MKITVFGATGGTGKEVVAQALAAGHDVTAVVRDPARLAGRDNLTVRTADVFDAEAIAPAVAGADAVISALGPRSIGGTSRICAGGTRAIVSAMSSTGVRRLACVSAAPVAVNDPADRGLYRWVARPVLHAIFRRPYADMAEMERVVRVGDTDWTVFRPPMLVDKPATSRYRTARDRNIDGGRTIARADLAAEILARLDDPAAYGHTIGLAY